jgi:hypothetical protein
MILEYISFPIFIVSFAIGIFFVYVYGPEMKKIYVYPTPENVNKVIFKDVTDSCFSFEAYEVDCPKNDFLISQIPVQN